MTVLQTLYLIMIYLVLNIIWQKKDNRTFYNIITLSYLAVLVWYTPILNKTDVLTVYQYLDAIKGTVLYISIGVIGAIITFLYYFKYSWYSKMVIPLLGYAVILLIPDITQNLTVQVIDTIYNVLMSIILLDITISGALFIISSYMFFHAWNYRELYLYPIGWLGYAIILISPLSLHQITIFN